MRHPELVMQPFRIKEKPEKECVLKREEAGCQFFCRLRIRFFVRVHPLELFISIQVDCIGR